MLISRRRLPEVIRMTVIGRTTQKLPVAAIPRVSWWRKFDALLDSMIEALTRCLCRASRGYLCPPDMTSVMYPDDAGLDDAGLEAQRPPNSRSKECCDEKLPGK